MIRAYETRKKFVIIGAIAFSSAEGGHVNQLFKLIIIKKMIKLFLSDHQIRN